MKHMNILGDTEVTIKNRREEALVRIFNNDCASYIEYMLDDDYTVGQDLLRYGHSHYLITELHGVAGAMFFMDMIEHPRSSVEIWRYLAREYARRAGEDKARQHMEVAIAIEM